MLYFDFSIYISWLAQRKIFKIYVINNRFEIGLLGHFLLLLALQTQRLTNGEPRRVVLINQRLDVSLIAIVLGLLLPVQISLIVDVAPHIMVLLIKRWW